MGELVPSPAGGCPFRGRRETVLRRFAARQDSFTPAAVEALLPGAGVRGVLLENEEGGLTIVLGRLLGITKEEATRELDQLLPSHLSWEWDESVTWVALDALPSQFCGVGRPGPLVDPAGEHFPGGSGKRL